MQRLAVLISRMRSESKRRSQSFLFFCLCMKAWKLSHCLFSAVITEVLRPSGSGVTAIYQPAGKRGRECLIPPLTNKTQHEQEKCDATFSSSLINYLRQCWRFSLDNLRRELFKSELNLFVFWVFLFNKNGYSTIFNPNSTPSLSIQFTM